MKEQKVYLMIPWFYTDCRALTPLHAPHMHVYLCTDLDGNCEQCCSIKMLLLNGTNADTGKEGMRKVSNA